MVVESLAQRGVPEVWADQQESGALSRMGRGRFVNWLTTDDAKGFPKPDPATGCRLVRRILDFWEKRAQGDDPVSQDDLENWDDEESERRSAA